MATQTQAPAEAPARFTTAHRTLSDALKIVALGVADRPIVPVLGGVMAETRNGTFTLRGFDYETSVTVRVDGEADEDGLTLLNFSELKQVMAAAVAGEKSAVAARTQVRVDGEVLSTTDLAVPLSTLPLEEYPAFPPDASSQVTVDGAEWFRQVARVLPAAGSDDTRPVLTYVHIRAVDGILSLTASDGYRVAIAEVTATEGGQSETVALVPAWLLARMATLLGKHTGPVTVGVAEDEGWVTFTVGAVTVTVRCPADLNDYPIIRNFLPSEAAPLTVRADREALVRAVRKASALSKAKGLKVGRVHLEFARDGVTVVSPGLEDDAEQSRVRGVEVACELLADASLDGPLKANGVFLLEALGSFTGDTLVLHAQTSAKPFLLTDGPSVAGEGYRHMLMPVRVR